jgi:multidrug efflux pump subunit AcrB
MFTVPLALAGALLSLWILGQTINIFSQIGMIMLIGLVTKNGILIVEFANQKQEQGMEKGKALLEASKQRLRPILMTRWQQCLEPYLLLYLWERRHRAVCHWEP